MSLEPTSRPYRILIADDEEDMLVTLRDILAPHGFDVTLARNGREAVELARATLPDVVLLDVRMPGFNGLEASRQMRRFHPDLPVIFMTAHGDDVLPSRTAADGTFQVLFKPFDPEHLLLTLWKTTGEASRNGRDS